MQRMGLQDLCFQSFFRHAPHHSLYSQPGGRGYRRFWRVAILVHNVAIFWSPYYTYRLVDFFGPLSHPAIPSSLAFETKVSSTTSPLSKSRRRRYLESCGLPRVAFILTYCSIVSFSSRLLNSMTPSHRDSNCR